MYYEKSLTIPKNTPSSAPVSAAIPVHPGVLKEVEVIFPPGPAGLAHVIIYYWGHQVFPSNPDSSFAGDDIKIEFNEEWDLPGVPFEFVVYGWNSDDTYPHTVTVRLGILPHDKDLLKIIAPAAVGARGPLTFTEG
jgi:hypothetical protein